MGVRCGTLALSSRWSYNEAGTRRRDAATETHFGDTASFLDAASLIAYCLKRPFLDDTGQLEIASCTTSVLSALVIREVRGSVHRNNWMINASLKFER